MLEGWFAGVLCAVRLTLMYCLCFCLCTFAGLDSGNIHPVRMASGTSGICICRQHSTTNVCDATPNLISSNAAEAAAVATAAIAAARVRINKYTAPSNQRHLFKMQQQQQQPHGRVKTIWAPPDGNFSNARENQLYGKKRPVPPLALTTLSRPRLTRSAKALAIDSRSKHPHRHSPRALDERASSSYLAPADVLAPLPRLLLWLPVAPLPCR